MCWHGSNCDYEKRTGKPCQFIHPPPKEQEMCWHGANCDYEMRTGNKCQFMHPIPEQKVPEMTPENFPPLPTMQVEEEESQVLSPPLQEEEEIVSEEEIIFMHDEEVEEVEEDQALPEINGNEYAMNYVRMYLEINGMWTHVYVPEKCIQQPIYQQTMCVA